MKSFSFLLITIFLGAQWCFAETYDNPAVREALRKHKQETADANEASGDQEEPSSSEVTRASKSTSRTFYSGGGGGPRRTVTENQVCNNELSVFAARPSESAPPLETCQMQLDSQFAEALQKYIPLCARSAAASQHWNIPTRVSLEQMGGYNVRKINTPAGKGGSWSRHSLGKALDISSLTLYNDTGSYKIDLTDRTQNQNFYDAFRTCWDNSMRSFLGSDCTCSIGHSHTHPPSNELHNDHMHISLSCPPQSGVAVCANI